MSSTPSKSPAQAPTPCRKLDEEPALAPARRGVPVAAQAGVVLLLLAVGLIVGGLIGGGLLLLVGAVLLVGLGVAWRRLATPERLLRFAAAFLIFALALVRMFPR